MKSRPINISSFLMLSGKPAKQWHRWQGALLLSVLLCSCDLLAPAPDSDVAAKPAASAAPVASDTGHAEPPLTASPTKPAAGNTVSESPKSENAPGMSEAALRTLLQQWLDAQNNGDFDSYQKLYATRFDGVKRAGKRTFQFNREGWIKDRAGMFKKPMVVQADDVKVRVAGPVGRIDFVQTWTSGKYSDRGPKVVMVTAEGGSLHIFREEMQKSQMARKQGQAKAPDWLRQFYFVVDGQYVVVDHLESSTQAENPSYKGNAVAEWSLHPQLGQSLFRDYVAGGLYVGNEEGNVARMQITDIVGLAKQIPHFGVFQQWEETHAAGQKMATDVIEWSRNDNTIFGAAVIPDKMEKAIWAMRDLGSAPVVYAKEELSAAEKKAVFTALQNSERSTEIQKWFAKDGYSGNWFDYNATPTIAGFRDKDGNRFVYAEISAGMGCGDFYESHESYFNLTTGIPIDIGAPADYFLSSFVDDHTPYVALDIDGDGFPEFIGKQKLMYKSGSEWFVHELQIPYGDCPC